MPLVNHAPVKMHPPEAIAAMAATLPPRVESTPEEIAARLGARRAGIGDNGGPPLEDPEPESKPEPTPLELSTKEIDDLYEEARNWLDGAAIENDAQEEAVEKLLGMFRDAGKLADTRRVAEKKPHDDAAKAVQERWKPALKQVERATEGCKAALTPWRDNKAKAAAAAAEAARQEAAAKLAAAQEAFRNSDVTNLAAREVAEELAAEAKAAEKTAKKADKAATTGLGLRTTYRAEVKDVREFARFVWLNHAQDIDGWLAEFAQGLVRSGLRAIPGVVVHEDKAAV